MKFTTVIALDLEGKLKSLYLGDDIKKAKALTKSVVASGKMAEAICIRNGRIVCRRRAAGRVSLRIIDEVPAEDEGTEDDETETDQETDPAEVI